MSELESDREEILYGIWSIIAWVLLITGEIEGIIDMVDFLLIQALIYALFFIGLLLSVRFISYLLYKLKVLK